MSNTNQKTPVPVDLSKLTTDELIAYITKIVGENEVVVIDLTNHLKKANDAVEGLTGQLSTATITVTNLTGQVNNLQTQFDAAREDYYKLQKEYQDLQNESVLEIGKLSEELSVVQKIADVADPTFLHKEKYHSIIGKGPFNVLFKGERKVVTVSDILKDKDLQKELVAMKAGFLTVKTTA